MDPRLLRFFWLPILFPVVKKGTIKGGAGGLPLQRKSKSNKGGAGGLPLQKRHNMQKRGGAGGPNFPLCDFATYSFFSLCTKIFLFLMHKNNFVGFVQSILLAVGKFPILKHPLTNQNWVNINIRNPFAFSTTT